MARSRIGKYRLVDRLARGGMGEVYVAQRDDSTTLCVVKVLRESLAGSADSVQRFKREAHVASMLRHPRIAQVIDAGFEDDCFYLAAELIAGKDLSRLALAMRARGQAMSVPVAVTVVAEVLEGLEYAHGARDANGAPMNVVHRDLKPSNVVVGFDGHASIIDFGVAYARIDGWRTVPGKVLGTLRYFSPEQARGLPVDARCDIYAASAILFELLAGRPLVDGKLEGDGVELIERIGAEPPSICAFNGAVSSALDAVVARGLARDPAARWPSAGALRKALLELVGTVDARVVGELVRVNSPQEAERYARAQAEVDASIPVLEPFPMPTRTELELPTTIDGVASQPSLSGEAVVVPTDLTTPGYSPGSVTPVITPTRTEIPATALRAQPLPSVPPPAVPSVPPGGTGVALVTPVATGPALVTPVAARRRVPWLPLGAAALGLALVLVVMARPEAQPEVVMVVEATSEPEVVAPPIGVVAAATVAEVPAAAPSAGAAEVPPDPRPEARPEPRSDPRAEPRAEPDAPVARRRPAPAPVTAAPSPSPSPRIDPRLAALRGDIARLIAEWDTLTPQARMTRFFDSRERLLGLAHNTSTKRTLSRMLRDDALRGDEQDARRLQDGLVLVEQDAP